MNNKERIEQEIRFLFKDNSALQIQEILDECFENVCAEFGCEKEIQKSINYEINLLEISMSEILNYYKIKVEGKMARCPFHKDKNPSLSFNDEKGLWKCWGCGAKGNTITFVRKMKEMQKNGDEQRSSRRIEKD